jgi:hypothetical protein
LPKKYGQNTGPTQPPHPTFQPPQPPFQPPHPPFEPDFQLGLPHLFHAAFPPNAPVAPIARACAALVRAIPACDLPKPVPLIFAAAALARAVPACDLPERVPLIFAAPV